MIDEQLRDGAVMIGNNSYSLGSLVVADTLNARANAGKDNSKVMADIASDPAYSNTGILVVLEPLAPILGPTLGITPTGERHGDFGDANVVLRCWTFDLICDFKDPSRDLWGSINSGVGYLTEHGGMDPLQSYATSATDKAQATTVVDGNVTKVTYHGELPTIRAYELATGLTVSDDGKRIANALVLSKGNPGEVQSYKTPLEVMSEATGIEIPSQGVAMPEVEDLTKDMNAQFNSIVEPIRAEVEKAVEPLLQNTIAYTSNDTSYEATPAAYSAPAQVDYTPIVENTAVAATSLVDDAVSSNVIPADLGAQLNAGINNFAAQGLALLGGK
ncbi:MAG: hypothetical protein EOO17_03845 [Chloroflexi bacterium]|nr:MAG: hypothetical protein EOO17_03845 [Chloroflexota bacterium]